MEEKTEGSQNQEWKPFFVNISYLSPNKPTTEDVEEVCVCVHIYIPFKIISLILGHGTVCSRYSAAPLKYCATGQTTVPQDL